MRSILTIRSSGVAALVLKRAQLKSFPAYRVFSTGLTHLDVSDPNLHRDFYPPPPITLVDEEDADKIEAAIQQALTSGFQAAAALCLTPFGDGHSSQRIAQVLVSYPLENLLHKRFFDSSLRMRPDIQ